MTPPQRVDVRHLLLDQLAIGWGLFEYHSASLVDEDLFWSPAAHRWTMHRVGDELLVLRRAVDADRAAPS